MGIFSWFKNLFRDREQEQHEAYLAYLRRISEAEELAFKTDASVAVVARVSNAKLSNTPIGNGYASRGVDTVRVDDDSDMLLPVLVAGAVIMGSGENHVQGNNDQCDYSSNLSSHSDGGGSDSSSSSSSDSGGCDSGGGGSSGE